MNRPSTTVLTAPLALCAACGPKIVRLEVTPGTARIYQIAPAFRPGHEAGVRWDDPAFAIAWPAAPALISPRDASYADHG